MNKHTQEHTQNAKSTPRVCVCAIVATEKKLPCYLFSTNTNFKLSSLYRNHKLPESVCPTLTLKTMFTCYPSVTTARTQTTLISPTLKANLRLMLSDCWTGAILKLSRGRLPKTPSSFSSGTDKHTETLLARSKNKQRTAFKKIRSTSPQPRFHKRDVR